MSELAEPLRRVLGETGYFGPDGGPAASTVAICNGDEPRRGSLKPDVRWNHANLNVYFKFEKNPAPEVVGTWQREVWNEGSVPLLWIVEPHQTTLYNGFAKPQPGGTATKARLGVYHHNGTASAHRSNSGISELDTCAGRLAMETGTFWRGETRVDRRHAVDARLLADIARLERKLRQSGLSVGRAQGLIGRAIFAQYLVDREIVPERLLQERSNRASLPAILENREQARKLFRWLIEKFKGDMFPNTGVFPAERHLALVVRFLRGEMEGQGSLFPYRFDLIPVELISAIYEQFVHSAGAESANKLDVHYTPLAAVSLIMDEVMQNITGEETVLDITCGSGVFLVEALRRLVNAKAQFGRRTRAAVRQALEHQVFGVDKSEAAIQVAAFSLYLAALEFDPNPWDEAGLEFAPLRDKTLHVDDALRVNLRTKFDIIVGNPPWSYPGKSATADRRTQGTARAKSPRGQSFDFANRAKSFAGDNTRFGMLLSATPFFAESGTGRQAAQELVQSLSPLTLIDLSAHHKWLFKKAQMPAMGIVARYRRQQDQEEMALVRVPWSHAAESGHSLKVSSSDVQTLHLESWRRNPMLFTSSFGGRLHDHLLIEDLVEREEPLEDRLAAVDTAFHAGWTRGDRRHDSTFLHGLPFLGATHHRRFFLQTDGLRQFDEPRAEHPRRRRIYKAPLLIVRKNLRMSPRPVVAVANKDVVYTKSCYGVPFPRKHGNLAYLLAGILSSSYAAWYLHAANFGLWKREILESTMNAMPVPDLVEVDATPNGKQVVDIVRSFQRHVGEGDPAEGHYEALDDAVAEVFGFGDSERMVIRDGLFRASWHWRAGWLESDKPVGKEHLKAYAEAFVSKFDPWFQTAKKRRLCATIYETKTLEPLCIIRFVLERQAPPSELRFAVPYGSTEQILTDACVRLNAPSAIEDFMRNGEVRLANESEVFIAKPSARRHWLAVNAFADARAILEESFRAP